METEIRTAAKEHIMPPPTIAWAKNSYTPLGDITRTPGITRIGIGSTLYDLREAGDHSVFLTTRLVDADPASTHIYIGNLGSSPSIKVAALSDRPFSLEDPERINAVAEISTKFVEIDTAFVASIKIDREGKKFLNQLVQIIPLTDQNLLGRIGVLGETLTQYVNHDYPSEFLKIADNMEQLGIAEIESNPLNQQGGNNVTVSFLRKTYGETTKEKQIA